MQGGVLIMLLLLLSSSSLLLLFLLCNINLSHREMLLKPFVTVVSSVTVFMNTNNNNCIVVWKQHMLRSLYMDNFGWCRRIFSVKGMGIMAFFHMEPIVYVCWLIYDYLWTISAILHKSLYITYNCILTLVPKFSPWSTMQLLTEFTPYQQNMLKSTKNFYMAFEVINMCGDKVHG